MGQVSTIGDARRQGRWTIWGLTPAQLHDRYWSARRLTVVRPGGGVRPGSGAALYLLVPSDLLVWFRVDRLLRVFCGAGSRVMLVYVHEAVSSSVEELAVGDREGRLRGLKRHYRQPQRRVVEVMVTADHDLACDWQAGVSRRALLRGGSVRGRRGRLHRIHLSGFAAREGSQEECTGLFLRMMQHWPDLDASVTCVRQASRRVWMQRDYHKPTDALWIGPLWVGEDRRVDELRSIAGPALIWDAPHGSPRGGGASIREVHPRVVRQPIHIQPGRVRGKRAFDVMVSGVILLLLGPTLFPLLMLAIWLEDGRPFFFSHARQGMGGKVFHCLKFRSMHHNAEQMKAVLLGRNEADGPQFYLKDDPRLTRVGRLMRRLNLDELPQLVNVLRGEMSLVGPRPSPDGENQFCPAWRYGRLSVRPGITGLWQVHRSREPGRDFEEWIVYDLQYVQQMSWGLDIRILWRTAMGALGISDF